MNESDSLSTIRIVPLRRHAQPPADRTEARWPVERVEALFALPFNDLIHQAQQVHREHFDANEVQLSTLLSIKTGGCPEDCGYCPQSVHFDTGVAAGKLRCHVPSASPFPCPSRVLKIGGFQCIQPNGRGR
jgi:biotin synthase